MLDQPGGGAKQMRNDQPDGGAKQTMAGNHNGGKPRGQIGKIPAITAWEPEITCTHFYDMWTYFLKSSHSFLPQIPFPIISNDICILILIKCKNVL